MRGSHHHHHHGSAQLSKEIKFRKIELKEGTMGPKIPQWPLTKEKLEGAKEIVQRLSL